MTDHLLLHSEITLQVTPTHVPASYRHVLSARPQGVKMPTPAVILRERNLSVCQQQNRRL